MHNELNVNIGFMYPLNLIKRDMKENWCVPNFHLHFFLVSNLKYRLLTYCFSLLNICHLSLTLRVRSPLGSESLVSECWMVRDRCTYQTPFQSHRQSRSEAGEWSEDSPEFSKLCDIGSDRPFIVHTVIGLVWNTVLFIEQYGGFIR